ncbi:MAG: MFS transporter [Candidatus Glassbacteria bacterium]|nr:MFS transporter [Candidatus Glassbacteria bacterium]
MDFVCAFMIGGVAVFALELGAGPVHLGTIGATGAALYIVCSILAGKLSDRFSRKRSLLLYCLLSLGASLLFTRAGSLVELYLYYGLFHVAIGLYWPTLQSLLADSRHGRNLSRTLSNFCLSWSLGFTVGHYTCGKLTEFDTILPFTWCVYLSLVIFALGFTLSEEEGGEKSASRDFLERPGVSSRLWSRFLVCGWIANFTLVFTLGAAKMLFPKLALDVDHLDRTELGIMLALIHGGQFAMFWLVKYWHSWQYNRRTYLLTQLLALPGAGLLAFSNSVAGYAAGMLLIGITAGFTYSSSIYYSTSRPPESANRTGIHEAFIGMGILFGPLAGGLVADIWNLHSPYVLALLLIAVSLALQAWLLLRSPQAGGVPDKPLV